MATSAEKSHMGKVAALGCILCRLIHHVYTDACVHHATGIKYRSMGKKASNFNVLPLCHTHHTGHLGIHTLGMRKWEQTMGYTQEQLLEMTNNLIAEMH